MHAKPARLGLRTLFSSRSTPLATAPVPQAPLTEKSFNRQDLAILDTKGGVGVFLLSLVALGGIGILDWAITSDISVSTLYLIPVSVVTWFNRRAAGLTVSFLAAVVWFFAEYSGRAPHPAASGALWQCVSRLSFYLVTAFLVDRVRALTLDLDRQVKARTAALEAEVVRRKALEEEAAEISEREQERIAGELHDELAAYLAGIAFRAKSLAESLERRGVPEATDADNVVRLVNQATEQVRSLARLLVPVESDENDLTGALSRLSREVETVYGITCPVDIDQSIPALSSEQCRQLYRIAQEAIRNAIQHAHSELVQVSVKREGNHLILTIQCDGQIWQPSSKPANGLGLRIMHHRTEKLGGTLSITNLTTGGAVVRCDVPVSGVGQVAP